MTATLLDRERAKASFNSKELQLVLQTERGLQFKASMERLLQGNPLFDKTDDFIISREEYVRKCVARSFETYRLLKANKDLLAQHSPLHGEGGAYVGQMGTPSGLSDHFSLFLGTLLSQATPEQQRKWVQPAVNLQIIGTYAQTELGHGSNVRGLETTAVYEEDTDTFLIHSPTVTSAKWWPGALGLLATHAIMYATLIIKGKDYGFHAFMIQLRDENLRPLPGIEVGDLGPKLGYGAYDSGYLRVANLRVPRFNMMARFQRVEKGGEYIKAPAALQKIAYLTMLKTRVFIAQHSAFALGKVVTIAVRYAAARRQGFVNTRTKGQLAAGTKLAEHAILDYPIIQDRLLPLIAMVFGIGLAGKALLQLLKEFEAKLQAAKGDEAARSLDASLLPALHATAAGLKAFTTQMSCNGMEEARKCCGGHGYTLSSGIGMHIWTLLPSITYEGDMVPMALQTARFLLKLATVIMSKGPGAKMPQGFEYLAKADEASKTPQTAEDFSNPSKLLELYQRASRHATRSAAKEVFGRVQSGVSQDAAALECQVALYRAAQTHVMCQLVASMTAGIALAKPELQAVLSRLCALFALDQLKVIVPSFLCLTPEQMAAAGAAKRTLCAAVRPDAVSLVDSFAFSDFELTSTIGSFQNDDLYERMVASARRNPLNSADYMRTFHSELLADRLNKELLRQGQTSMMPKL